MRALAVIPARYNSTRYPGKPLVKIGERCMLHHVWQNVVDSNLFSEVIIATDHEEIYSTAVAWGAKVEMTSTEHPSGTDRCAEVLAKYKNQHFDCIINIQGDEPFISSVPLTQIVGLFKRPEVQIGTLYKYISDAKDYNNPNTVKMIHDVNGKAIYFSRYPIPYIREPAEAHFSHQRHIGLYGFRPDILTRIVSLPVSSLEKAECLEQLRWIEHGFSIHAEETQYEMISVDTPEDLLKAEEFLNKLKSNYNGH